MSSTLARYLAPWKHKRRLEEERVAALRERDGDSCRRCRRTMRFDLPRGHDLGPRIEPMVAGSTSEMAALQDLCLTHHRCNNEPADFTAEVRERIRRRNEADLFASSRVKRRA